MTKQEALNYYYSLRDLALKLRNNAIHDLADKAEQLAFDISLVYRITTVEIQTGKLE